MGLLLVLFLLPVCLVVYFQRRRARASAIVPLLLIIYSVVSFLMMLLGIVHSLAGMAGIEPALKATLFARGLSELWASMLISSAVHIPLLAGAYLVDRWLRARRLTSPARPQTKLT